VCGIFGCLSEGAPKAILEGLKRLEYRGYDSVGYAVIRGGRVEVRKEKGRISDFIKSLGTQRLAGNVGIGHTRWATHGAPCKENAHPHTDCAEAVAVVHNGVLENFMQLREELMARGHRFSSNTDTEVIPHIIEEGLESGLNLRDSVARVLVKVIGSMAIAAISCKEPDRIVCARRDSPLVLGIGEKGCFCASDITALLPFTRDVLMMQDETVAVLTKKGIRVTDVSGRSVKADFVKVDWDEGMAEKGGYDHFMIKEIFEQPLAIKETLKMPQGFIDRCASLLDNGFYMTGSGTSFHACLSASYALSRRLGMDARPVLSSEFIDAVGDLCGKTVVAVSQSGETADTLGAIKHAKSKGAKILGITNTLGSSLTRLSDAYLCTQSGPEIGVAATKTFITQLTALNMLAIRLGMRRGVLSEADGASEMAAMGKLPKLVATQLDGAGKVKALSMRYAGRKNAFFLGRGINVATAMEGALKLKELSYIHAEGYAAGESKHGPISLVEPGFLCVFIAPKDSTRSRTLGNVMEMKARGAYILSVITCGDRELEEVSDDFIEIPEAGEIIYPMLCTVPLQLFAYYIAAIRGLDPDKPRNLAKSVTVL
jgi:glucosamine--fructose-6-phosphate aminotransferase (isomerizing)